MNAPTNEEERLKRGGWVKAAVGGALGVAAGASFATIHHYEGQQLRDAQQAWKLIEGRVVDASVLWHGKPLPLASMKQEDAEWLGTQEQSSQLGLRLERKDGVELYTITVPQEVIPRLHARLQDMNRVLSLAELARECGKTEEELRQEITEEGNVSCLAKPPTNEVDKVLSEGAITSTPEPIKAPRK